jgi:hypothetical protein
MELLAEFELNLKHAISASHTGTVSPDHAWRLLADAGGKGMSTVQFVNMAMRDGDMLDVLYSYDIGSYTVGNFIALNDSLLVITADRKYLVSQQHLPGEPLGMEETRITAPTQNCPSLVHLAQNNYKVLTQGTFQCTTYGGHQSKISTWGEGQYVTLGHMDSCTTDCTAVGPSQYRIEHRVLGSFPSVHPIMLRQRVAASTLIMQDRDSKQQETRKMQREMHALIEDTRTQIELINSEQQADKSVISGGHDKWVIAGGVLLIMVLGGVAIWWAIASCRSRTTKVGNDPEANGNREVNTRDARPHQPQVMEMRILPPESVYRQYGPPRNG